VTDLVLRRVEVDGELVDVGVDGDSISAIGSGLGGGDVEIDGEGGALVPGLHDHHLHLFAMAAAGRSVDVSGDALAALWAADATLAPGEWIRAVDWHESSGWELDRGTLDYAVPGRPVRVQHASGALWVLNSPALEAVGMADHPTGRLFGMDDELRRRLGGDPPDLGEVGRQLASVGVTGVTDATPYERADDLATLARAVEAIPQRVAVTGAPGVDVSSVGRLLVGPAKIVVADHDPPSVEVLVELIGAARADGRAVAFHCASRLGLVLALSALEAAGAMTGDRIEHGAVIPPDSVDVLARLGLTVVTQPALVAERGDRWLADVDADDRPHLWPCASLLRAGVAVAGSSDAPHGPADPWAAIAAAVDRRTSSGQVVAEGERLDALSALGLFLGPLDGPGGPPRRVEVGAPADLCLLRAPLDEVLREPDASAVRATVVAGRAV
jgi:predicted amidohydrolase YtcJ